MTLYTIGYQGKTVTEYIRTLKKQDVALVVDVRLNPISRKRGFSKNQLEEALNQEGIRYRHLVELGNPKEIRAEFYKNGSAIIMYEQYKQHLDENPSAFRLLLDTIEGENACLMCFERLPSLCHRGAIAEYLREQVPHFKVVHL